MPWSIQCIATAPHGVHVSGVSRPAIARIELGTSSVQTDRLWDLAEALSTTPSALLADAEHHLPQTVCTDGS
ncbi:helix-turn-helix domain-containing protein [Nocardia niigatensis]